MLRCSNRLGETPRACPAWPMRSRDFLARAGFDRGPWLAVALADGNRRLVRACRARQWWVAMIAACLVVALGGAGDVARRRRREVSWSSPASAPGCCVAAGVVADLDAIGARRRRADRAARLDGHRRQGARPHRAARRRPCPPACWRRASGAGARSRSRVNVPLEQDNPDVARRRAGAAERAADAARAADASGRLRFRPHGLVRGVCRDGQRAGPGQVIGQAGEPVLAPLQRRLSRACPAPARRLAGGDRRGLCQRRSRLDFGCRRSGHARRRPYAPAVDQRPAR